MYVLLLNALIDAARKRGSRNVMTGNDLAEILEEAKREYLRRVDEKAGEDRERTDAQTKMDIKRISTH